jgi:hypothetical protein
MAQPRVAAHAARRSRGISGFLTAIALVGAAIAAGCGDLAGADIVLAPTSLRADFGSTPGTVPSLACTAGDKSACMAVPAPAGVSGWQVGCDTAAGQCFGQAELRIQQTVAATDPSSFDSAVGQQAVRYLRSIDIAYTIPSNTLTFALAKIQLFIARNAAAGGTGTVAPDGGVVVEQAPAPPDDVLVGDAVPLAAGQVIGDARHLSIGDGDPAFGVVSSQVEAGQDLVLVLVVSPRVLAGAPMPAGAVEVLCQPKLHFSLRWSQVF